LHIGARSIRLKVSRLAAFVKSLLASYRVFLLL